VAASPPAARGDFRAAPPRSVTPTGAFGTQQPAGPTRSVPPQRSVYVAPPPAQADHPASRPSQPVYVPRSASPPSPPPAPRTAPSPPQPSAPRSNQMHPN
jgi:hypothetical protein